MQLIPFAAFYKHVTSHFLAGYKFTAGENFLAKHSASIFLPTTQTFDILFGEY